MEEQKYRSSDEIEKELREARKLIEIEKSKQGIHNSKVTSIILAILSIIAIVLGYVYKDFLFGHLQTY